MKIMGMNSHIIKPKEDGVSENITIMGYPFYANDIESDEPFNRREMKFTSIIGGTERTTSGEYIHREFSFTSIISHPTGEPNAYDKIFEKMQSKPVQVVSKNMGKSFNAMIKIRKSYPAPNRIKLDVTVTEVPDVKSNIPGETTLTVPKVKKIKVTTKKKQSSKSKNNSKNKKNKNKRNSKTKKNKGK